MAATKILWIVTTQWRAQATGYVGDPQARTPALDGLPAKSVSYTQAVTPHPMGPFARAALLTGIRSPANGVREYFDPLPADARTVAHDLRERGVATAYFGKWHLGQRDPAAPLVGETHAQQIVPPDRRGGFEFWEGFESGFLLNDPWLHGTALATPQPFRGYQSDVLVDRFAAWLGREAKPRATFAVVSFEAPHPPYDAPAGGVRPEAADKIVLSPNVPRGGETEAKARRELSGYYAHLTATDRAIGRLLELVGEDWTIVFTSVHGDMHGAHGLFRKGWPHEESIRVPLLVRRPGVASRRDDAAISLADLPRLALDWIDGRESSAVAQRKHAQISMPSVVALPHQCDRAWSGVRTKNRKAVWNADGVPWLFFDLERDPFEMMNLVGDASRRDELTELKKLA